MADASTDVSSVRVRTGVASTVPLSATARRQQHAATIVVAAAAAASDCPFRTVLGRHVERPFARLVGRGAFEARSRKPPLPPLVLLPPSLLP